MARKQNSVTKAFRTAVGSSRILTDRDDQIFYQANIYDPETKTGLFLAGGLGRSDIFHPSASFSNAKIVIPGGRSNNSITSGASLKYILSLISNENIATETKTILKQKLSTALTQESIVKNNPSLKENIEEFYSGQSEKIVQEERSVDMFSEFTSATSMGREDKDVPKDAPTSEAVRGLIDFNDERLQKMEEDEAAQDKIRKKEEDKIDKEISEDEEKLRQLKRLRSLRETGTSQKIKKTPQEFSEQIRTIELENERLTKLAEQALEVVKSSKLARQAPPQSSSGESKQPSAPPQSSSGESKQPSAPPQPVPSATPIDESVVIGIPVATIIDEPRPTPRSEESMDFSGESVEARIDQAENIFDFVSNSNLQIPEYIKRSAAQGVKVIKEGIKEGKSKKSLISKISNIAKGVLGFIALSPLPFPPQIKAGAGAVLLGIQAVEEVVDLVSGEGSETGSIERVIENASNVEELKPVADLANGIIETIDAVIGVRDTFFKGQENKDGLDSTPVNPDLVEEGLQDTRAVESVRKSEYVDASEGQTTGEDRTEFEAPIEIQDEDGNVIENVEPGKANNILATGELNESEENLKEAEGQSSQPSQEEQVISGNQQPQGFYEDAIHPDALGIFFGSSTFPQWDNKMLEDRNKRFEDLSPSDVAPFLLQQTNMIWEANKVDLLVPKLIYGQGSDPVLIEKENHEILQLWKKLKGIKSGGSDMVGMKLGDLMKFRGLLSSGSGPTAPNPISTSGSQVPEPTSSPSEEPTQPTKDLIKKDKVKRFVYSNSSGIRLGQVVSQEILESAEVAKLSEIVTLDGAQPLEQRRNLTRGFSHGGPVARSDVMNGIRTSVVGTSSKFVDPKSTGNAIHPNDENFRVKVKVGIPDDEC